MPTRHPHLAHSLKPRDLAPLVTLDDATAYLLALPDDIADRQAWQHAAALAIDARETPTKAALVALTRQIELALLTTYRLDLSVDRGKLSRTKRPACFLSK
jgi:hypothetical protein